MRILLDECVPRGLKRRFGPEHDVQTVPEAGLGGYSNGAVLNRSNDIADVQPLIPVLLVRLNEAVAGQLLVIE